MFADIIIIVILAVLLGGACLYMKKSKKKGVACIGCPDAGTCAKRLHGDSCNTSDSL